MFFQPKQNSHAVHRSSCVSHFVFYNESAVSIGCIFRLIHHHHTSLPPPPKSRNQPSKENCFANPIVLCCIVTCNNHLASYDISLQYIYATPHCVVPWDIILHQIIWNCIIYCNTFVSYCIVLDVMHCVVTSRIRDAIVTSYSVGLRWLSLTRDCVMLFLYFSPGFSPDQFVSYNPWGSFFHSIFLPHLEICLQTSYALQLRASPWTWHISRA